MGPSLPKVYPELRPLKKVKIRSYDHWHGDGPEPPGLLPWQRLPGGPTSTTWKAHIGRSEEEVKKGKGKKDETDHAGVNDEKVHDHVEYAKYAFPPGGYFLDGEYEHDHGLSWKRYAAADRPHYRDRHVARQHKGVDVEGPHAHPKFAKDPTPLARRIDVHPLAVDLLHRSSVAFFVIEGCIKADAVLAAGQAVFSVPSVSLWDCGRDEVPELSELGRFVRDHLNRKTVIIVPDADWAGKDEVVNQARLCQNRLRQFGIRDTHIAAPPPQLGTEDTKGVDDFIGAGGLLEDLRVIDYAPPDGLIEFVARNWRWWRDQLDRNAEVLAAMANYTGESGRLCAPLSTVARVMNVNAMRVGRAVRDLVEIGAITVEGDLSERRSWFSHRYEWAERPSLVLAPELCPKEMTPQRLGDVLDDEPLRRVIAAA